MKMKIRKMKRKVTVNGGIKKVGGYLLAIGLLVALTAGPAAAWKITFENGSGYNVNCTVYGEHLFWRQNDCEVKVNNKETKDCVMPGGICPRAVSCKGRGGEDSIEFGGAQCWDHSYKISSFKDKVKLGN
jgi:hypothetical protein